MLLSELIQTFVNLRQTWPQNWPGLPTVLASALRRLGQDPALAVDARAEALRVCAFEVAQIIESQSVDPAKKQAEPTYHNRLHFADVLVGLTALLLQTPERTQQKAAQSWETAEKRADALTLPEWRAILTVIAHDWQHPGTINQFPAQIESFTVAQLRPMMHRSGVAVEDQDVVAQLILNTDPRCVKDAHAAIQNQPFDLSHLACMTVLIQEADILASATPQIGPGLTEQLALEWQAHSPEMAASLRTPQGRLNFLRFGALFNSAPSLRLGLDKMVSEQIQALTAGSS